MQTNEKQDIYIAVYRRKTVILYLHEYKVCKDIGTLAQQYIKLCFQFASAPTFHYLCIEEKQ